MYIYICICMQCNGPHNTIYIHCYIKCIQTASSLLGLWLLRVKIECFTPWVCMCHAFEGFQQYVRTYILNWLEGVRLSLCIEVYIWCCSLFRCLHSYHCLLGSTVGCNHDHIWNCYSRVVLENSQAETEWYNYQSDCSMLIIVNVSISVDSCIFSCSLSVNYQRYPSPSPPPPPNDPDCIHLQPNPSYYPVERGHR